MYLFEQIGRLYAAACETFGAIGGFFVIFGVVWVSLGLITLLLDLILQIYRGVKAVQRKKDEKMRRERWLQTHGEWVAMQINEQAFAELGNDYGISLLHVYAVNGEKPVFDEARRQVFLPLGQVTLRAGRRKREINYSVFASGLRRRRWRHILLGYRQMLRGYREMLGIIDMKAEEKRRLGYGVPIELTVKKSCRYEIKVDPYDNEIHIVIVDERDKSTVIEVPAEAGFETVTERDNRQKFRPDSIKKDKREDI